jgi:hypothetical protein
MPVGRRAMNGGSRREQVVGGRISVVGTRGNCPAMLLPPVMLWDARSHQVRIGGPARGATGEAAQTSRLPSPLHSLGF